MGRTDVSSTDVHRADADPGADVVEALGIPALRFEILSQLRGTPLSVTQLMERTGLSRGAVNSHLHALERGALVSRTARPTARSPKPVAFYRLEEAELQRGLDRIAVGA